MSAPQTCSSCGASLPQGTPPGPCLECLGRMAFSMIPPAKDPLEIRRLGDYELLEEVGRGGMGVVYRARQLSLNRTVAVKVILNGPFASEEFVQRFRTEAEAAAALSHPNIVAIHEVGERDGNHFLSMEYIDGRSVAALVRDHPLPARRAADYAHTIAQALQHAHEHGVIHRDIKPSNILLDPFDQPHITDFGLAKIRHQDADLTLTGQVLGTPNFIPPEQAAGKMTEVGVAADVYSLGAVLYHLLTGRPPFQGETLHEILQQVQEAVPIAPRRLNPSVPIDLQTICLKCLQKEPARRYGSALEVAEELGSFLAGRPIRARPISKTETAWLWCKRHPALASLSLALVVAVTGGLGGVSYEWRQSARYAQGETEQRVLAQKQAAVTRLNLYAADVALASQVMQQGDLGRARRTLERLVPLPGETDLRGFEWRYLWDRCRSNQIATLIGHEWIVTCVAYAPDGRTIASGGMGGTIKVWDTAARVCQKTLQLGHEGVWTVEFTPDNGALLAAGSDGVVFWDTRSWEVLARFPGKLAALSRDGTRLATSGSGPFFFDPTGPVDIWDWKEKRRIMRLTEEGRALAFSADGRTLAMAGPQHDIRLWDVASGRPLRLMTTGNSVWSLAFSPDGTELLSAGWSGEVLVWPLSNDSLPRRFSANHLNVWHAEFSPDGQRIVTASSDQIVRLWNRSNLVQTAEYRGHDSEVWCASFRADGRELASGGKDQKVMLWTVVPDRRDDRIVQRNSIPPVFSPDGSKLLTLSYSSAAPANLWDCQQRTLIAPDPASGRTVVGFSPDGEAVVSMGIDFHTLEHWLPPFNAPSAKITLQGTTNSEARYILLRMSPEQTFLLAIDPKGVIRIWNAETGHLASEIQGPVPPIRNAVLSTQGRFLAVSLERSNDVFLFETATRKEVLLKGHKDFVSGLAFSPDRQTLATGSMDGTIRLWTADEGRPTGVLPGHLEETTDVAFSPDGRTLASLGQRDSVKLWHLPTMREVFSEILPACGERLQFSPDGLHLTANTVEGRLIIFTAPK